jgi:protease I
MDSNLLTAEYTPVPDALRARLVGESVDVPKFEKGEALTGYHVALVASHGPELPEFHAPFSFLNKQGATVDVVTQDWVFDHQPEAPGVIVLAQWLATNVCVQADKKVSDVDVENCDAVVLLGGAWNPILLRTDDGVLEFLRNARGGNLLIAAVCHGPQILINVGGFAPGTKVTGVADIRQDLTNAGFDVHDTPVVYDEQARLVTGRDPRALGEFCTEISARLQERNARTRSATSG